jgi:cytochrome c-type biogenesis protein
MSGGVEHLVLSGPVLLAIPVAVAAGAITFLSPCCLPLVPGYLSYVTGMSGTSVESDGSGGDGASTTGASTTGASTTGARATGVPAAADAAAGSARAGADWAGSATGTVASTTGASTTGASTTGASTTGASTTGAATTGASTTGTAAAVGAPGRPAARGRVMLGTLLFVLGFSVLFALEGVTVSSIGDALASHSAVITKVLGCVIIALGLLFMGAFDRFGFAGRIFRPSFRPRAGLAGAPLLGVLFGLGWTPCIGPTLSAVLLLGSNSGTALRGGLLAFVYGLGIGIPFLVVAFAVQRGVSVFGFARRHARLITRIGGVMLIAVGVLEVSGAWASAVLWLKEHWLSSYTSPL